MSLLGPLVFLSPWALAALAALPALWWLLRATPPAPKRIWFPPLRLLLGLTSRQETPSRTPWWLVALRLLICTLVILALARPVWNAIALAPGGGPVALLLDNGWAAGRNWTASTQEAAALVEAAERADRAVAVMTTADPLTEPELLAPREARERLGVLRPRPWPADATQAAVTLGRSLQGATVFWLTDGLDKPEVQPTMAALREAGPLTVLTPTPENLPLVLQQPERMADAMAVRVSRPVAAGTQQVGLLARDEQGRPLARGQATFAADAREANARLALPPELLERVARIEIEGGETAASVALLDERWRRRPVGIADSGGSTVQQPLLDPRHYARRAISPFADVRTGGVRELLEQPLSLMILADPPGFDADSVQRLTAWIEQGGVLVRFAGPNLARMASENSEPPLLPVRLRPGTRNLGGALSWARPEPLAPFPPDSPLGGLDVPRDVTIATQVLAEPAIDLSTKTWARLADGTPVVTGERRGEGWLVLVHTATVPGWSNLTVSSLFVDMLRRFVGISKGVTSASGGVPMPPLDLLDGFGRGGAEHAEARALPPDAADVRPGPQHPPGLYGQGDVRRALNLSPFVATMAPFQTAEAEARAFGAQREHHLAPYLWTMALLLFLCDMIIALLLRGLLPRFARPAAAALAALALLGAADGHAADEVAALEAANSTRLAYVLSGDSEVDEISRAGLWGLSVVVNRRTAVELGDPVGVDPARDDLALYPLLYWPVTADTQPDELAAEHVNAFMRNGGTVLFDTRDGGGGEASAALAGLGGSLQLPVLRPVPQGHVLSRTFYLLEQDQERFPGRWAGGTVWVQANPEADNDGVSPVIVGSHDWAAAWALNPAHMPMFAVVPDGERQRERALRFGVNLVMYVLTGNYKADQVHAPAIMQRLSR